MSEQFFSVEHSLPINVTPLPADYPLPELAVLEQEMPMPFRIAGNTGRVEPGTSHHLRAMDDQFGVLVDVINLQSRKINLLLSYLLTQLDDPDCRCLTTRIGASELWFHHPQALVEGTPLRLKIFLQEYGGAVYCYGVVNHVQRSPEEHGPALIQATYTRLREEDKETLVQASLLIQSRQLKLRAEQRANLKN